MSTPIMSSNPIPKVTVLDIVLDITKLLYDTLFFYKT